METQKRPLNDNPPATIKAFGQWKVANPWLRFGAQAIDQGLVGIVTIGILCFWFPRKAGGPHWITAAALLWIFVSVVTQGFFSAYYKNTPGKKIMGLKLQSARPMHEISGYQGVIRAFIWWLGLFTFGSGWMTILTRPDRRAWHDLAADTTVVTNGDENAFITPLQKRIGETWFGVLVFIFMATLLFVFTIEFNELKGAAIRFRTPSTQMALERESWLLLAGGPSYAAIEGPINDADAPLKELMLLFTKARQLPPGERFDFYRRNMQRTEDSLCPQGYETTMPCESARAMAQLLSVEPHEAVHSHALPGLYAFEQLESHEKVADQMHFLTEEMAKARPGSVEDLALKTAQARLFLKSGEFHEAKLALDAQIKIFQGRAVVPEDRFFEQTMTKFSCEAQALDGCRFDPASSCATDPYWRQWASGCQLTQAPSTFTNAAQALGYWWMQSQSNKPIQSLEGWNKVKKDFETDNARDFEKYVFKALDFVLNAKAVSPGDVMGLFKQISPESPVWGWSQNQALKVFGSQWAYLIPPDDQKLLNRYGLQENAPDRGVASEEK